MKIIASSEGALTVVTASADAAVHGACGHCPLISAKNKLYETLCVQMYHMSIQSMDFICLICLNLRRHADLDKHLK